MRVTIFGGTGLLGNALTRVWQGDELTALGSKDADIRSPQAIKGVIDQHRPDWIVLAAAYTDVDGCETNQQLAFDVNTQGAINVAEAAKAGGTRLLFLSSDYVFDGEKRSPYEIGDARSPRSVYGKTKAAAEEQLLNILPECCIVRTSWVFGVDGKCFPDTMLKLAASRSELEVVDDQRGSPTYTADLAHVIQELCHSDARGIIHATNAGACSWFEFGRYILNKAGSSALVKPTTTEKFPRPAQRPKYSVLSPASLHGYGIHMASWTDAAERYLAERSSRTKLVQH
jgi:dTDP-4-dehydrorhamnose reductase